MEHESCCAGWPCYHTARDQQALLISVFLSFSVFLLSANFCIHLRSFCLLFCCGLSLIYSHFHGRFIDVAS